MKYFMDNRRGRSPVVTYLAHVARCERLGARPLGYVRWLRLRDFLSRGR